MPRIKAITTGSIPSFLDVILNFAESDTSATLVTQDTWPTQLAAKDFTEVDNNVTRHVPFELDQKDWNGMIMHYLGLDHIGHKSGPRSPHMVPKHREMDAIVEQVYQAIQTKEHLTSTLLVLCGDHGMNDAGNHGGSAPGETSPALVFMSPKLKAISFGNSCPIEKQPDEYQYYSVVEQSDIAPTLAGLLGFPVPLNNLGVFIPDFLRFWPETERVALMARNAQQVLRIVQTTFPDTSFDKLTDTTGCVDPASDALELTCRWTAVQALFKDGEESSEDKIRLLTEFLQAAQRILSSAASNYDVSKLQLGLTVVAMACGFAVASLVAQGEESSSIWTVVLALGYGTMMFASSFVEEEHHFWYWVTCGWLTWLYLKLSQKDLTIAKAHPWYPAILLAINRIIRRWNQTGQKHAGEPDIAKTFFPSHRMLLWVLVSITILDLARRLVWHGSKVSRLSGILSLLLCLLVFAFKVTFTIADAPELLFEIPHKIWKPLEGTPLVTQARTVFAGITVFMLFNMYRGLQRKLGSCKTFPDIAWTLHDLLTLFLIMQTRVTNIPLYLLLYTELHVIDALDMRADEITLTSIIFQYVTFFASGGSNAISSIDLSNAYNGISGYNVAAVGFLTFVSNWAGPIWWASATNLLLLDKSSQRRLEKYLRHIALLTTFTASSLFFVMLACTILRTHLFIWTVFSPKYLYSMAWSLGQHLAVNVTIGGLLFWIGSADAL
ncbi:major facilitator super transporter protein [Lambiella insularis]|nr:major facilitator super transporter protein [Lambiella insularis]